MDNSINPEDAPALTDIQVGEETVLVESPEHIAARSFLEKTEADRALIAEGVKYDPEFLKKIARDATSKDHFDTSEESKLLQEAMDRHPSSGLKHLFRNNPEALQQLRNETGQLYTDQPSVAFHDQAIYAVQQEHYVEGLTPPANSDLFVVWFVKVLGNWKALVGQKSTTNYYEVTFNGAKQEAYVDRYGKISNTVIPAEKIEINYPEGLL
jgi:hypothetical protein